LIVRDVRDVALSFHTRWGKDEVLCAHKWRKRMGMALATLRTLPQEQSYILRYEDLLIEPERMIREIFAFLNIYHVDALASCPCDEGLSWDNKSKEGNKHVMKLDLHRIGKWRRSLPKVTAERVEEVSFDLLETFGYTPQFAKRF